MSPTTRRRIFLVVLVLVTILVAFILPGCALTPSNRFMDRADVARADLSSPAMVARLCAAGAATPECRR